MVQSIQSPTITGFDYDTLTLSQALPWFKGSLLILAGCVLAGMLSLVGLSLGSSKATSECLDYQI